MNTKDILLILLPIIAAILSSYMTYYFSILLKRKEAITKFKEEKYINLILSLQGFIGKTASDELKKKFFEEQYKSWLYSSDDVVIAINNLIKMIIESAGKKPDPDRGREAIGKIILAMRKDLLGKTKLDHASFGYTDILV